MRWEWWPIQGKGWGLGLWAHLWNGDFPRKLTLLGFISQVKLGLLLGFLSFLLAAVHLIYPMTRGNHVSSCRGSSGREKIKIWSRCKWRFWNSCRGHVIRKTPHVCHVVSASQRFDVGFCSVVAASRRFDVYFCWVVIRSGLTILVIILTIIIMMRRWRRRWW